MTAASSIHRTSTAEAAFEAAVVRGVALIGVLKGFTRRVFGLGRAMKEMLVRLDKEGVDRYSGNSGLDVVGVLNLLSRALHLADALRARLRTAAVALALVRTRSAPQWERIERQAEDEDYDPEDPLRRISYGRGDEKSRQAYREAIADMSDREVIEHIYTNLLCASAMLGETEEAAQVAVLGHKAAGLLAEVNEAAAADEVLPDEEAPERGDHAMADAGSDTAHVPGARPPPRAVEREPP